MVQWLGLSGTFTTRTRVQSLIRELRSLQAKKKKKKAMSVGKKWANNMKKKKKSQKKYKHLINMLYFIGCISVPRPMSLASESRGLITGMPRNSLKLIF